MSLPWPVPHGCELAARQSPVPVRIVDALAGGASASSVRPDIGSDAMPIAGGVGNDDHSQPAVPHRRRRGHGARNRQRGECVEAPSSQTHSTSTSAPQTIAVAQLVAPPTLLMNPDNNHPKPPLCSNADLGSVTRQGLRMAREPYSAPRISLALETTSAAAWNGNRNLAYSVSATSSVTQSMQAHADQQSWRQGPLCSLLEMEDLDDISQEAAPMLFQFMQGNVAEMALDTRGCRVVQRALELVEVAKQDVLMNEMRGHVGQALESPHANHVMQRAIELMRPSAMRFVLTELRQWGPPAALARHRYGCRVLERIMEHFPLSWLDDFIQDMLADTKELSRHMYGNFVMQHLLEHGEPPHRTRIISLLCNDLPGVALDQHGCSVLDKALSYGVLEEQRQLATLVLRTHGLLAEMAKQRGGFAATQRLFKVVDGDLLEDAKTQLTQQARSILNTKHGKALISVLLPEFATSHGHAAGGPRRAAMKCHAQSRSGTDPYGAMVASNRNNSSGSSGINHSIGSTQRNTIPTNSAGFGKYQRLAGTSRACF